MAQQTLWKRLLLLFILIGALSMSAVVTFAQEGAATEAAETAPEGEAESPAEAVEEEAAEEGSTSPLVPLGINTGFLLAQIVNFLLLFFLLRSLVWQPMRNMLDNRAATIQKGLEDAAAAANARRNAEAEAEQIRQNARAEVARTLEEARSRGDSLVRDAERSAAAEAERIRTESRAAAEEERNRQLGELRSQVAAIGVAVAERLIGQSLDQSRQQALINDFFAKVPAEARSMGGDVEVVSAMPLSEQEQNAVRGEVGGGNVTFRVDPSILGGLVVRSADRVVDGSVRSGLTDLAGRLR
ncbi:MAG: F0F1 ATP synthase subunit B [bacterium]|nr:F0F1 ATP synthase subunit B [bacterium]